MGIPLPPPWVLLSLILAGSKHIQDVKDIAGLSWAILRGRSEGGCQLCDKLVGVVLKQVELDDLSEGGGIDCRSMCFKVGKCIETCDKITNAMVNSTGFPCIAAGLCPAADEFGEVSCAWSYKSMGCVPATACEYKFPKCELRDGYKKWKQVSRLLSDQLGQFDDAFRHRKKCSEPNAGPYCIRESEGLGFLAEWGGLLLIFLGGATCSIYAIETPGGDDDRQWLTFWMMMMAFFLFERVSDVVLSSVWRYYELKLCDGLAHVCPRRRFGLLWRALVAAATPARLPIPTAAHDAALRGGVHRAPSAANARGRPPCRPRCADDEPHERQRRARALRSAKPATALRDSV